MNIPFVFFGTPDIAVFLLEELAARGFSPALIVAAPDRKKGRGLLLAPPETVVWAKARNIPVLQPEKLDIDFISMLNTQYRVQSTLFIVVGYGKIIPKSVLDIPKYGALNVHPSLLPKYRGASPIPSAILSGDKETGVTIMLVDAEMDHGNIIEERRLEIGSMDAKELGEKLAQKGGEMLAEIIPRWVSGKIDTVFQDHAQATYTKKITKEDGLIELSGDAEMNWRKFRAYIGWPGVYFFAKRNEGNIRIKITDAALEGGVFITKRVIPEGGKEMDYNDFLRGN